MASLAVAAPSPSASCESPRIGFMGPITGDAAFIGKEQLGFSRYAIRKLGGGTIKLVEGDTRFDPARAATVAATFHANPDILAVVGPARSREVLAVAPVFMRAERLPFISGSALDRSLTNGSIPNFFRVVPNDSVQSRDDREVHPPRAEGEERLRRRRSVDLFEGAREGRRSRS